MIVHVSAAGLSLAHQAGESRFRVLAIEQRPPVSGSASITRITARPGKNQGPFAKSVDPICCWADAEALVHRVLCSMSIRFRSGTRLGPRLINNVCGR